MSSNCILCSLPILLDQGLKMYLNNSEQSSVWFDQKSHNQSIEKLFFKLKKGLTSTTSTAHIEPTCITEQLQYPGSVFIATGFSNSANSLLCYGFEEQFVQLKTSNVCITLLAPYDTVMCFIPPLFSCLSSKEAVLDVGDFLFTH